MDENDMLLDDCMVFNNSTETWSRVNAKIQGDRLPPLCQHASAAVITTELSNSNKFTIFNHPEFLTELNNSELRLSIGTFVFGGMVQEYNSNHELEERAVNSLYFIQTGKSNFKVVSIVPRNVNKSPQPRMLHSMSYDEHNHYLVV